MDHPRAKTFAAATALFFVSGALGLGYELIWIREAALVVGASQIALSTVLTAFFLGLGLGSYFVGRHLRSTRWGSLRLYGWFEIAIGTFALCFPFLFRLLRDAYGAAYPLFSGSEVALTGLRFALLFLLFLPPTFFMGGTLPLLLDGLARDDRRIGSRASFLYGINILGAVAGVVATCYLAIPGLGLSGTSIAGGVVNLGVGFLALALFRRESLPVGREDTFPLSRFYPAAALASGALALGYQVAWTRYFSLVQFSTVYLTAAILAVYLLALGCGSLLLAPALASRVRPLPLFSLSQALAAPLVLLGLGWWRAADYGIAVQRNASGVVPTLEIAADFPRFWQVLNETADAVFLAPMLQVGLAIFIPVVLLGVGLPSLIAAAAPRAAVLKSVSGRLFFWNTLGASLGSFLTGYALLPALGLQKTLIVLGFGSTIVAGFAAWSAMGGTRRVATAGGHSPPPRAARRLPGVATLGFALLAAVAVAVLGWTEEDATTRAVRGRQFGRDQAGARLTGLVEGPLATAWMFEEDGVIRIGTGAVQMGNVVKGSVNLQAIEGHLPALFYPGNGVPQDCLGICLGSGQSFGALLRHAIRRMDVVEISAEITSLAGARALGEYNNHLLVDPRVTIHLDDGRHFVERAPTASYDVVSMESPPPISDGAHGLYTEEFYVQVRRVLRPGGVFMQFMPLYYLSPSDTRHVIRTLARVFPETFVVRVSPGDFMLLAYPSRP